MRKSLKAARKLIVALIGFPLLLLGIVLIPVPGPGLLVCFLALLILSTEFSWADGLRRKVWDKLKTIFEQAQDKAKAQQSRAVNDNQNAASSKPAVKDDTDQRR